MPDNTVYRTTLGTIDKTRYYIEIIPRELHALDDPTIEYFSLESIDGDWEITDNLNDDKFGLKRPEGFSVRIDLELLPNDLKTYLLQPFVSHDMANEFPYNAATDLEIPNIDLTNVFLLKTDEGDSGLAIDNFKIKHKFGSKKNPGKKFTIRKTDELTSNKLDIVLHDLFRVVTEGMHPIYFTWLAVEDIVNQTLHTPKETERVYDYIYSDHGPITDYYTVKVTKQLLPGQSLDSTTLDGVVLSIGDRAMIRDLSDPGNWRLYVVELVDNSPTYEIIREYKFLGLLNNNDFVGVTHGTNAGKLMQIVVQYTEPGFGYSGAYADYIEYDDNTTLTRIIAKLDGNVNGQKAFYFPVTAMNVYYKNTFDFIYKKYMRVEQSNTEYVLDIDNDLLYSYTFREQTYDRSYTVGDGLTSSELHFCALVANANVFVDGFFVENDGGIGIYEYENMWDILENIKGHALVASYYSNDKKMQLTYDSLRGEILEDNSLLSLSIDEVVLTEKEILEIETDTEVVRGVVVNINVEGDNRNEHKFIKIGSFTDEELSIKGMFHNNPSASIDEDGWVETDQHPEIKSSLETSVVKTADPLNTWDIHKLVYFDTPASIVDSEIAVRPHSSLAVEISGFNSSYLGLPINGLPIQSDPWQDLKFATLKLQRHTGSPYFTAKKLADSLNTAGRAIITVLVPYSKIEGYPVGNKVILDISELLINGDEPSVTDTWYILSKKITANERYVEVKLIER